MDYKSFQKLTVNIIEKIVIIIKSYTILFFQEIHFHYYVLYLKNSVDQEY